MGMDGSCVLVTMDLHLDLYVILCRCRRCVPKCCSFAWRIGLYEELFRIRQVGTAELPSLSPLLVSCSGHYGHYPLHFRSLFLFPGRIIPASLFPLSPHSSAKIKQIFVLKRPELKEIRKGLTHIWLGSILSTKAEKELVNTAASIKHIR